MGLKTGKDEKPTVRRAKLKLRPPYCWFSITLTNLQKVKSGEALPRRFLPPQFFHSHIFFHSTFFSLLS